MRIQGAIVASAVVLLAGCNSPGKVSGEFEGEQFGKVLEVIFVDDSSSGFSNYKFMIASFPNACTNYSYYSQYLEYDDEQLFESEEEMDPHFLLFLMSGNEGDEVGTHELLPEGQFYPDTFFSTSGRFYDNDGNGEFNVSWMNGGSLTIEQLIPGESATGTFTGYFGSAGGDEFDGKFEATYCQP